MLRACLALIMQISADHRNYRLEASSALKGLRSRSQVQRIALLYLRDFSTSAHRDRACLDCRMYVRANHKQKSSVKDNSSHPVWDPDGKMPFVFAVRRKADVCASNELLRSLAETEGCTRLTASPDKALACALACAGMRCQL